MTKRGHDPLAGVRVGGSSPEAKAAEGEEAAASGAPAEEKQPEAPKPPPAPAPVVAPPVPPAKVQRYRVSAMKQVTINGTPTTFKLGRVISAESHGPRTVEMLLAAKVLEPIDDEPTK